MTVKWSETYIIYILDSRSANYIGIFTEFNKTQSTTSYCFVNTISTHICVVCGEKYGIIARKVGWWKRKKYNYYCPFVQKTYCLRIFHVIVKQKPDSMRIRWGMFVCMCDAWCRCVFMCWVIDVGFWQINPLPKLFIAIIFWYEVLFFNFTGDDKLIIDPKTLMYIKLKWSN